MSRPARVLLSLALVLAAPAAGAQDAPTELPPIDVTRERSLLDRQRPRWERLTPCLGCDASPERNRDDFLISVLNFAVLPSEPPDNRDQVAASEVDPPLARFDDKHRP